MVECRQGDRGGEQHSWGRTSISLGAASNVSHHNDANTHKLSYTRPVSLMGQKGIARAANGQFTLPSWASLHTASQTTLSHSGPVLGGSPQQSQPHPRPPPFAACSPFPLSGAALGY